MPGRSTPIGAVDGAANRIGPHQIRPWTQQVEARSQGPSRLDTPETDRTPRPGPRDSRQERQFPPAAAATNASDLAAPGFSWNRLPGCFPVPGKRLAVRLRLGRELRQAHRNTPDGHPLACHPDGRLIIADHDIVLGPGEVAEFDTRIPHWFGPSDDQPAEILSLLSGHGKHLHVRAAAPARAKKD